jgi:hypothetical protein
VNSPPWRSVSGGIVAVVVIALLVFSVMKFARTGVLRGDQFRLYVAVPDASNLLKGSQVWLNGQRIGTVTSIGFGPPTLPPDVRVIIGTDILESMREHIRLDSRVKLRSGGTIIGEPVVYIGSGTPAMRAVVPGDTIRGAGKSDFEIAASRVTESLEDVPATIADAKTIMARAKATGSRMSGIMSADRGHGSFTEQAGALMDKVSRGRGSGRRIMSDTEIRSAMTRSMARVDSLRTLFASRKNELGRFRRDTSILVTVGELREEVAQLRALASSPEGTVGRMRADSSLRRGLDSAFVELTALFTDIRKNPLRYSRVF